MISKYIRPVLVACLLLACVTSVYGQQLNNVSIGATGLTNPASSAGATGLTSSAGAGIAPPAPAAGVGQLNIDTTGTGKADSVGSLYDLNSNGVPDTLVVPLAAEITINPAAGFTSPASPAPTAGPIKPVKVAEPMAVDFHLTGNGINETTLGLYIDENNNGKVDTIVLPLGDNPKLTTAGDVLTLLYVTNSGLTSDGKKPK